MFARETVSRRNSAEQTQPSQTSKAQRQGWKMRKWKNDLNRAKTAQPMWLKG